MWLFIDSMAICFVKCSFIDETFVAIYISVTWGEASSSLFNLTLPVLLQEPKTSQNHRYIHDVKEEDIMNKALPLMTHDYSPPPLHFSCPIAIYISVTWGEVSSLLFNLTLPVLLQEP